MDANFSKADELKKLKDLFDSGVLTQSEFDAQKKLLLNSGVSTFNPSSEASEPLNANLLPTTPPRKKKKYGCFLVLLAFLIFIALLLIGIIMSASGQASKAPDSSSISGNSSASTLRSEEDWLEFDTRSWKDFGKLYVAHNMLTTNMNASADGTISLLSFYNNCKSLESFFAEVSVAINYGTTDEDKTYLRVLTQIALQDQITAQKLMKYIDTNEMKYLSEANENLKIAKEATILFASNRNILLGKAGLTNEEIEKKLTEDLTALDNEVLEKTGSR